MAESPVPLPPQALDAIRQQAKDWLHEAGPDIKRPEDVRAELVRREVAVVPIVRDLLRALSECQQRTSWQDISMAPKDGTPEIKEKP